ncbi:cyclic nucleotide-binding domain-containing protein, partial [Streptomyces sp. NRRL S-1896]|uniref:cyclic nucleotide-binding domain-containing protein n=1 Tax=Streptomyces sp. NRRL S-1896 TaxID=1463893 RepID=UPI0004CDBAC0
DEAALGELARRCTQRAYAPGDVIVEAGAPADRVFLLAHGRVEKVGSGPYGDEAVVDVLADGGYFGDGSLLDGEATWEHTHRAATACAAHPAIRAVAGPEVTAPRGCPGRAAASVMPHPRPRPP